MHIHIIYIYIFKSLTLSLYHKCIHITSLVVDQSLHILPKFYIRLPRPQQEFYGEFARVPWQVTVGLCHPMLPSAAVETSCVSP